MAAKGFLRGHPLIWVDEKWIYEDDHTDISANGGEIRPCVKCGELFSLDEGEVDLCLGILPGVDNACCGHGIRSESYIRFESGLVIKDFNMGHWRL